MCRYKDRLHPGHLIRLSEEVTKYMLTTEHLLGLWSVFGFRLVFEEQGQPVRVHQHPDHEPGPIATGLGTAFLSRILGRASIIMVVGCIVPILTLVWRWQFSRSALLLERVRYGSIILPHAIWSPNLLYRCYKWLIRIVLAVKSRSRAHEVWAIQGHPSEPLSYIVGYNARVLQWLREQVSAENRVKRNPTHVRIEIRKVRLGFLL